MKIHNLWLDGRQPPKTKNRINTLTIYIGSAENHLTESPLSFDPFHQEQFSHQFRRFCEFAMETAVMATTITITSTSVSAETTWIPAPSIINGIFTTIYSPIRTIITLTTVLISISLTTENTSALPTHAADTSTLVPIVTVTTTAGLSTGAKAGIGIAIPCIVLILALVGAFIFMRRKNKRSGEIETGHAALYLKPELEAIEASKKAPQPAHADIAELPPDSWAHEHQVEGFTSSPTHQSLPVLVATPVVSAGHQSPPIREQDSNALTPTVDLIGDRGAENTSPAVVDPTTTSQIMEDTSPSVVNQKAAEEDENIEVLQKRLQAIKEERERLAKMDKLSRQEEELERRIALKLASKSP